MSKYAVYKDGEFLYYGATIQNTLDKAGRYCAEFKEFIKEHKKEVVIHYEDYELINVDTKAGQFENKLRLLCILARKTDGAEEIIELARQALMNKRLTNMNDRRFKNENVR